MPDRRLIPRPHQRRSSRAPAHAQAHIGNSNGGRMVSLRTKVNGLCGGGAAGLGVPGHPAAAAGDLGLSGWADGHLPESPDKGRPVPGLQGSRNGQGDRQVQDHLLAWLRLHQGERVPGVPGACRGAGDLPALLRQSRLGNKFYVVGCSMGGYTAWSCLHSIPQRLAGVALVVPAVNYWWPLSANVSRSLFEKLDVRDRRTFWIAHHYAVAVLLPDHAELVPDVADHQRGARRVHRQGLGDPHQAPGKERESGQMDPENKCHGVRPGSRIPVPRRDGPVRQLGVRSHEDQEPVSQRRGRRQHLAGVRGQDRSCRDPALRGAEAAVGAVPRATRSWARAPEHGWRGGRHHQGALCSARR